MIKIIKNILKKYNSFFVVGIILVSHFIFFDSLDGPSANHSIMRGGYSCECAGILKVVDAYESQCIGIRSNCISHDNQRQYLFSFEYPSTEDYKHIRKINIEKYEYVLEEDINFFERVYSLFANKI